MPHEPIAIVGAACRLPGASNLEQFWDLLISGRHAIGEIPDERWTKSFYFHPSGTSRGKSYTWAAGIIEGIDLFDADFFGISRREAEQIDPQQRLFLELAWEALEDAGLDATRLAGSGGGVYVGSSSTDYGTLLQGDPAAGNAYFMSGNALSVIANRVSHFLDLHGPSFTVDTACSSAAVALNLACEAIREGRVPFAVVGGVNLLLSPNPFIGLCGASMLSRQGRCFTFDDRADGYVRSEGGGAVILKPLTAALADGDLIRALIVESGTNQDGHTTGLSLPSRAAQGALLRALYAAADMQPDRLSFIEAHGTGTPVGDPIEAGALSDAVASRRQTPLPIGSVKTNIGHLEAASGMASLFKVMLSLERRVLPPSLNHDIPNRHIDFDALNLRVITTPLALPNEGTIFAGINSFGFGGSNAHIILASPPPAVASKSPRSETKPPPLLISARSKDALHALAQRWSGILRGVPAESAAPVLRAAARRRTHFAHRLVLADKICTLMADHLDAFVRAEQSNVVIAGTTVAGKLAFVYSGNGAQWHGMARDALTMSTAFRAALVSLDDILGPMLGWSVVDRLLADDDPAALEDTSVAQPLLFAVQVGITQALRAQGIEAAAHLGHSVGEIAAAWAAGALSLADACAVIVARSRQQSRTRGMGRMAVLRLGPEAAQDAIVRSGGLEIAAVNSDNSVTLVGSAAAIQNFAATAEAAGWRYQPLDLDYPFHSAAMNLIQQDLLASLASIAPVDCAGRFVSSVTGAVAEGSSLDAEYWWRNIRMPVQFREAVNHLIAEDFRIFVEIGPNSILQSFLSDQLRSATVEGRLVRTLTRLPAERDPFPDIAAHCHVSGYDISDSEAFAGETVLRGLPSYPWQRERHWMTFTSEGIDLVHPIHEHPLLGFHHSNERTWFNQLDSSLQPWLADHVFEGVSLLPAAAMIEMALAAARANFDGAMALEVADFETMRGLPIDDGAPREVRVRLYEDARIEIASRARLSDEAWTLHAAGRVLRAERISSPVPFPANPMPTRVVDAEVIYRIASAMGLDYGPQFRRIAYVEITAPGAATVHFDPHAACRGDYLLDPTFLDSAFQGFIALHAEPKGRSWDTAFLPLRFGQFRLLAPYGRRPASARIAIERSGTRSISGSVVLLDSDGGIIATARECWFHQVRSGRRADPGQHSFRFTLAAVPSGEDLGGVDIDVAAIRAAVKPCESASPDIAKLFDAFLVSALQQVARSVFPDYAAARVDALIAAGRLAPMAAPLFCAMLDFLARHGAAAKTEDGWQLTSDNLPPPGVIWRTLLDDEPRMVAELALTASALDSLPSVFREGFAAAPVQPLSLLDQFLYASPSGANAVDALCDSVLAIAEGWPKGRPLRILEIAAGSGVLTRRLLTRLAGQVRQTAYVASDPDPDKTAVLAAIVSPFASARAQRFDLRGAEDVQGIESFDLVLSVHGLTRLGADSVALSALYRRLAPGGVLLMAEPEPHAVWDLLFGCTPAWWQENPALGGVLSPLRDSKGWEDALVKAEFSTTPCQVLGRASWPVQLVVAQRPAQTMPETRQRASGGSAVVLATRGDPAAAALVKQLSQLGLSAQALDYPSVGDGSQLCTAITAGGEAAVEIVVLPGPDPASGDLIAKTSARLTSMLTVAKLAASTRAGVRLWVVTLDAQQSTTATIDNGAAGAALWGIVRTIANETPQLDCRLIDLPAAWNPDKIACSLATEVGFPDGESEILWTPAGRRALRLIRGLPAQQPDPSGPVELTISQPGRLDSLCWKTARRGALRHGEIALEVKAAGLNFRDVMWALGVLPEEALLDGFAGPCLGVECAGIVSAVGPGETGFAVGDHVMAIAPNSFSTQVITMADAAMHLPEGMSFAAGATIPVAYLTVVYALGTLAQLQAGERVLIHGGAGGVGLAAIRYAQHVGAEVIATTGSEAKRAFLRQLGLDHVLDSRSLAFADAVKEITRGEGVDVVLNSLDGEAMERSLGLLKPFGRFLELGKRDFYLNTHVGLRPLRKNVAYFAIDADRLHKERPTLAKRLLGDVLALMEQGALQPLPYRSFGYSEVVEAFRLMQGAGHIGKIVLVPERQPAAQPAPLRRVFALLADATYLVTGGLSGFGLATAQWLADCGARHLALLGRRGDNTPGAAPTLVELRRRGIDVRVFACDVADAAAVAASLAKIRATMPPLRGVFHAAMAIDDGLIGDLTAQRIQGVLAPKFGGAVNLDLQTRRDPIELFVLYSSATSVLGAPGQGSYVAANAALEWVARARAALGLPALAVAWGAIGDVGYLARHDKKGDALTRRLAVVPFTAREALSALPHLWSSGEPVVAFAAMKWDQAGRHLPVLASPTFAALAAHGAKGDVIDLAERLAELDTDAAVKLVLDVLREETAQIMLLAAERIDPYRALSEFGMDSLMAVELRLAIESRLGIDLPMLSLTAGTTLSSIAMRIVKASSTGLDDGDIVTAALHHETDEESVAELDVEALVRVQSNSGGQAP